MKKALLLAALTAVLLVLPGSADGWHGSPYKVDCGFKLWFNIQPATPYPNLAPWYLYYPAEAQFQTPSPWGNYSQWPAAAPGLMPPAQPQPLPPAQPTIRPTSYYYSPAPTYWYR